MRPPWRQEQILALLKQDDRMSYDEIALALGIGKTTVKQCLDALENKNLITRKRGQARSIRVVKEP